MLCSVIVAVIVRGMFFSESNCIFTLFQTQYSAFFIFFNTVHLLSFEFVVQHVQG